MSCFSSSFHPHLAFRDEISHFQIDQTVTTWHTSASSSLEKNVLIDTTFIERLKLRSTELHRRRMNWTEWLCQSSSFSGDANQKIKKHPHRTWHEYALNKVTMNRESDGKRWKKRDEMVFALWNQHNHPSFRIIWIFLNNERLILSFYIIKITKINKSSSFLLVYWI